LAFIADLPGEIRPKRVRGALVFFFFSNSSGCLGSLVISAVGTLILLLIFGVIDFN
jgi:hypothetical protein